MVEFKAQAPVKILIDDFRHFEKAEGNWIYNCSERNSSIHISKIIIQGKIIKTAGFSNEILIVDDGTAKAKITRGSNVPGDTSWVNAGTYCSVVGVLVEKGKLPVIFAHKISKITNKILLEMWPWEVKESKGVITDKIVVKLPNDNDTEVFDCFTTDI